MVLLLYLGAIPAGEKNMTPEDSDLMIEPSKRIAWGDRYQGTHVMD
jgi:hypothetical protein